MRQIVDRSAQARQSALQVVNNCSEEGAPMRADPVDGDHRVMQQCMVVDEPMTAIV
jgi:hypothetical protein